MCVTAQPFNRLILEHTPFPNAMTSNWKILPNLLAFHSIVLYSSIPPCLISAVRTNNSSCSVILIDMQRLESISLGSYSFFNVETIRLQSCVDHFHSFLDNPVLRQIQLGESALMGNPDDDRKMHTDPPYNYLNAIFLESTLYHPHFAIICCPPNHFIR